MGVTEDEMVAWHHQLNGHEFEQTPGASEGQESLVCCSAWGCKESDTEQRNKNEQCLLDGGWSVNAHLSSSSLFPPVSQSVFPLLFLEPPVLHLI